MDLFFQYHAELGIRNLLNNPDALAGITADLDRRIRPVGTAYKQLIDLWRDVMPTFSQSVGIG